MVTNCIDNNRGALSNELLMYDLAWENLELVGGNLQIIDETYNSVTVQNIGWGAAQRNCRR